MVRENHVATRVLLLLFLYVTMLSPKAFADDADAVPIDKLPIRITFEAHNSMDSRKQTYIKQGDAYIFKGSVLPKESILPVLQGISDSRAQSGLKVSKLPLNESMLAMHQQSLKDLLATASPELSQFVSNHKLDLEFSDVASVASKIVNQHGAVEHGTSISFEATWDKGNTPRVIVSSEGAAPYLLPWKIQYGKKCWRSYDVNIPIALSRCSTYLFPMTYLDGQNWWTHEFWQQRRYWQAAFLGLINRCVLEILRKQQLDSSSFEIVAAGVEDPDHPRLSIHLKSLSEHAVVNQVHCTLPLNMKLEDWKSITAFTQDAEREANVVLSNMESDSRKSQEIAIFCEEYQKTFRDSFSKLGSSFWNSSGLHTVPSFSFVILENDIPKSIVFKTPESERMLVLPIEVKIHSNLESELRNILKTANRSEFKIVTR